MATRLVVKLESDAEVPFDGERLDPVVIEGALHIVANNPRSHVGIFGLGEWRSVIRQDATA